MRGIIMNEPLRYDQIQYNEPILWLEQRWGRKLDNHEINLVKMVYRWTRTTQEAEELKILEVLK
jgi:hypothetical protein